MFRVFVDTKNIFRHDCLRDPHTKSIDATFCGGSQQFDEVVFDNVTTQTVPEFLVEKLIWNEAFNDDRRADSSKFYILSDSACNRRKIFTAFGEIMVMPLQKGFFRHTEPDSSIVASFVTATKIQNRVPKIFGIAEKVDRSILKRCRIGKLQAMIQEITCRIGTRAMKRRHEAKVFG